jgi:hypothetical protein
MDTVLEYGRIRGNDVQSISFDCNNFDMPIQVNGSEKIGKLNFFMWFCCH